jgi:hypothetical protein
MGDKGAGQEPMEEDHGEGKNPYRIVAPENYSKLGYS